MGRLTSKQIVEQMRTMKRTKKFDGKNFDLVAHERFGSRKRARKDASWYTTRGFKVRIVDRGKGVFSVYVREH